MGRRLFDEPMLAGAENQKQFQGLLLRHFQEKRDREFSLDRLGRSGVDRTVVKYLAPRAEAAGQKLKPAKLFHGWAVIRASLISNAPTGASMPLTPSPIAGTDLNDNIYHAHATLPEGDAYSIALHLRHLFTSHGSVLPHVQHASPPHRGFMSRVRLRLNRLFQTIVVAARLLRK